MSHGNVVVNASCPDCGGIKVAPTDIRLVICTVAAWSFYELTCPSCMVLVRKFPSADVITLLSNAVEAERWHVPEEAAEPHAGPSLTWDDLLDFKLRLDGYSLAIVEAAAGSLEAPGG